MRDVALDHFYTTAAGQVLATGLQALVRLPLEQARFDKARGLNNGGFVAGYRGSPLGGYDMELANALKNHAVEADAARIVLQPAINEELAATAIWGTQQIHLMPGPTADGVFGIWYGKAPGVDRAIDPLRHGNFAGVSPTGGVVMLVGDDPECKSSTLPSQSEYALVHAEIPILNPSDVQECLDFGMIGFALSRWSGCWVAVMATSDNMESHAVIDVGLDRYKSLPVRDAADLPPLYIRHNDTALTQEARLRGLKLPAVLDFVRRAGLNKRVIDGPARRLGIVTTGRAAAEVMQALQDLGLTQHQAADLGISILKIDMPWPLDAETVRDFAHGLSEIIVVEDKRPLLEGLLKEALYGMDAPPRVVGKRDADGKALLPDTAIIHSTQIAQAIVGRMPANVVCFADAKIKRRALAGEPPKETREPFFCSGCPHNRSTKVAPGSAALAGIGCHYLVRFGPNRETDLFSQMGGEGVQWVGQAPFTTRQHIFANIGDGTYTHSGILAIRQAVASGANITYKILFNGAVAMTGGQGMDSGVDVPTMTRQLAAEGVARIAIVAEDPSRYDNETDFAPGTTIHAREHLSDVEDTFRTVPGVTAIIYDQMCATEKRRKRKRGLMAEPDTRVFINELVCEGCGDCTVKSNCLSVEPIETAFGRKRRINQSSCNKDYSCLEGFCPSFVTVTGGTRRRLDVTALLNEPLPAPPRAALDRPHNILISGIGGLGVTTLAGILSMAAFLEGLGVRTLNQPGLAQKGGGVTSHIRIATARDQLAIPSIPTGEADLHLAYDMIGGARGIMRERMSAERTATLVNSDLHPTSGFLSNTDRTYQRDALLEDIRKSSKQMDLVAASRLAETVMGTELFGNMVMLGYALQKGWLPLSLDSLDRAIVLNAAAAAQNRQALALGRLAAVAPEKIKAFIGEIDKPLSPPPSADLDTLIAERAAYLTAYRNKAYAARYTDLVSRARAAENGKTTLTEAVARGAFAAMLIKDEYEVARLLSAPGFHRQIANTFTGDVTVTYNLAPSWLSKTGDKRRFGPWFTKILKVLAALKFLRETPLDPFNTDPLRRKERSLREDYVARMNELLAHLSPENYATAVEIATLPTEIRGYGHVKERAMAKAAAKLQTLLEKFRAPKPSAAA